jgi:GntR family transcriptional regulator
LTTWNGRAKVHSVLNPASPLPLYQQLAELLRQDIESGALSPGARLPSEPQLSKRHQIGRPTVRQATELLVQGGLIERRRGSGTFVRNQPRRIDLFSLGGTLQSFRAGGVALSSKLLGRVTERRVAPDADNPFSEQTALVLTRLSSVDKRPVLFERIYFAPQLFAGLDRLALSGVSLSRVVEERYYLKATHAEQTFRVALPPEDVRHALDVSAKSALLQVKRALFFPRAPRAVFCELFCRTDELSFSQKIGVELRDD